MNQFLLILVVALVSGIGVYIFLKKNESKQPDSQDLNRLIESQFFNFSRQIDDKINYHFKVQTESEKRVKESLLEASKSYKDVEAKLNSLHEVSRKIYEVGKDVSGLHDILRAPKLRGNMGEFMLEELLKQILPVENFELQYGFASGVKVDAVVKLTKGKFVCIDAKFPLENFVKMQELEDIEKLKVKSLFLKDVKKHVTDISSKYINPAEGTFDFALMYIPAENVYYELILNDSEFINFAYSKKVIPVSPNNLFIYLQTILMGLKGFQIEQNAKKIYETLGQLGVYFDKFNNEFSTLGSHINNAKAKFDSADKRLVSLSEAIEGVVGNSMIDEQKIPDEISQN